MEIKAVKFRKDGFYSQPFPTLQAGQGKVQQGLKESAKTINLLT